MPGQAGFAPAVDLVALAIGILASACMAKLASDYAYLAFGSEMRLHILSASCQLMAASRACIRSSGGILMRYLQWLGMWCGRFEVNA